MRNTAEFPLRWSGIVLMCVLLAGCSTPIGSPPAEGSTTLNSVDVRNLDTEAHSVDILIERNGTLAYWTTVHVDAKRNGTLGSAIVSSEQFTNQSDGYVIKARLDNRTTGSEFHLSSTETSSCYVVQIRIEDDETLTFATAQGAYECPSN